MALAYETIKNMGKLDKLNKKPLNYKIIPQEKLMEEIQKKKNETKKINENYQIFFFN